MIIKTYTELSRIDNFRDRYEYLKLSGIVGESTFGFDRFLNQALYSSRRWKSIRDSVIIRDNGCDMGLDGFEIGDKIIVHHMNPITVDDVESGNEEIYNPEFLVCVSYSTHNAIHYGDVSLLPKDPVERRPNDMCPWRR